jgi:hypothetical protein
MATDYKIGVSIALANGVSPVLATIMRDLAGLGTRIKSVEAGFGGWKTALGGVAAVLATGEIVKGVIAIAKAGGEVNHQLELMKIAGMDNANIQLAYAQALQTSGAVTTTTLAENLAHIRELRYAFGETTAAVAHLDEISKANAVLNAVNTKVGGGAGGVDQVWALVKSLEQKGETFDPAAFSSYVNTMTKVVEATGGKVTPEMFMSTFKYGRTAMLGWNEGFVGGALPRLMQSWASGGGGGGSGSGGPGNALMSAFAKVVQGQMPKKAAQNWEEMGLTPGGVQHIEGASESIVPKIAGADLFMANPYEWVQQVLMPALAAKGITSQNEIIARVSGMFPVRTAGAAITEMALQGRFHEGANSPYEKDIALQKGAMGLPGYEELIKNDYPTVLRAFSQQFENLLQTLGSPLMQPGGAAITALSGLANVMASLAQSAGSGTLKSIIDVIGQIGAIATTIGGFELRAISAITGFGTMFEIFGGLPWATISAGLAAVNNGLAGLAGVLDKVQHLFGIGGAAAKPADPNFEDRWNALKQKSMMFNPGTSKTKATQTAFSFNVDGRVLAQTVIEQMEAIIEHASSSPNYNGLQAFNRADGGLGTT